MKVLCAFLVCSLFLGTEGKSYPETRFKRETCDPAYLKISDTHSACIDPAPGAVADGFSEDEIIRIIDRHNELRNEEPSVAMLKVAWDDELAYVAQKWADQCTLAHDANIDRRLPSLSGVPVGQNAYWAKGGNPTAESAINSWHGEIKDFEYGTGANPEGAVIGHYTQVVMKDVSLIGCGRTRCPGDETIIMCNYARGQYSEHYLKPYEFCDNDSCKLNCTNREGNLCDCGGLTCLNSGVLDKTLCSCRCKQHFSGPQCETVDCDSVPPESSESPTYCDHKKNCHYNSHACPFKCGLCNTTNPCTPCENGGTLNSFTCGCSCPEGFSGPQCQDQVSSCDPDWECINDGVLDESTCRCRCTEGYEGPNCQIRENSPVCQRIRSDPDRNCGLPFIGRLCCYDL